MFENPRRGRQARNLTTSVLKILDLKSSSEQIFSETCRWVPLNVGYWYWELLESLLALKMGVLCNIMPSFLLFVLFLLFIFLFSMYCIYLCPISNGNYMMVCDWSEIGLTTVRGVTDSFHRVLYLRYFLWNRWQRSDKGLQFLQNGRIKGNQIHEAV